MMQLRFNRRIQSTWPLSCTISRSVFYQKILAVLPVIVGDVPVTAVHVRQLHSEHVVAIGLVAATHALVVERGPGVEHAAETRGLHGHCCQLQLGPE